MALLPLRVFCGLPGVPMRGVRERPGRLLVRVEVLGHGIPVKHGRQFINGNVFPRLVISGGFSDDDVDAESHRLFSRFGYTFQKHSLLAHRRDELGQVGARR